MVRKPADTRSAEEWAVIGEAAKKQLATAPARSLTAIVQENLESIERRLSRGWTVAQIVDEFSEVGVSVTVDVFKNTLYRARQKKLKAALGGRDYPQGRIEHVEVPRAPAAQKSMQPRPPRYIPPTTSIRWDGK